MRQRYRVHDEGTDRREDYWIRFNYREIKGVGRRRKKIEGVGGHYCILSRDLEYIDNTEFDFRVNVINGTGYMLNACIKGVVNNAGIKD